MGNRRAFTVSQVSAFRLARHHFLDRAPADLVAMCRDVCGIQAQVTSAAHLAFWTRAHTITPHEIESALWEKRSLVKTNCMRGTLHYLTAEDYPIYIAALKGGRTRRLHSFMAHYGVTGQEAAAAKAAALETLGAGPMTRRQLTGRVLARIKVSQKAREWFQKSWWGVVYEGIVEGLICYGAERENEITLVRVDQWLPHTKAVPESQAQQILFRRFLGAYGPATLRDFSKWTGLAVRAGRAAAESLNDELMEVEVVGKKALILRQDEEALGKRALDEPIVRLLPNFDPFMLAHAEKDHLVDARHYKKVYRNQGWISPVVLLNGKAVGTWSFKRVGEKWPLRVEPFEKLATSIKERIEAEAASLGNFLGAQLEIEFKK